MNTPFGRAWTAAEEDVLRERYGTSGAARAIAAEIGRSTYAVWHRAKHLGVQERRPWTIGDDEKLRALWELHPTRGIARRLKRTTRAVYARACEIGIVRETGRLYESATAAAKRTGFDRQHLVEILKRAGVAHVAVSRHPAGYKKRPYYRLDPFEVDEAIATWTARENVSGAARRRGTSQMVLVRALKAIGVTRPADLPKHKRWRLDDETIDRALRARAAA